MGNVIKTLVIIFMIASMMLFPLDALADDKGLALVKQGLQSLESRNYVVAKQLAMQALALDSKNVNAYILLGDVEYMTQNMPAAKKAWQQAANLVPNNKQIQDRLARISREADTETKMSNKEDIFFNIKIDGDLAGSVNYNVGEALNKARMAVSGDFNYFQHGKIPVVVYNLLEYKDTLTEAPDWSNGAYDGKIRIILSPNRTNYKLLDSTIVHEYTHAVVGDLSDNHCPRWLNEGLAKYEEYRHGITPIISVLALAYNTNNILPWDKIDEAFNDANQSIILLAYIQSYSFVYYLVEKYGIYRLRPLLENLATDPDLAKAFNKTYNIPLETAQKNWRTWLMDFIHKWAEEDVQ